MTGVSAVSYLLSFAGWLVQQGARLRRGELRCCREVPDNYPEKKKLFFLLAEIKKKLSERLPFKREGRIVEQKINSTYAARDVAAQSGRQVREGMRKSVGVEYDRAH